MLTGPRAGAPLEGCSQSPRGDGLPERGRATGTPGLAPTTSPAWPEPGRVPSQGPLRGPGARLFPFGQRIASPAPDQGAGERRAPPFFTGGGDESSQGTCRARPAQAALAPPREGSAPPGVGPTRCGGSPTSSFESLGTRAGKSQPRMLGAGQRAAPSRGCPTQAARRAGEDPVLDERATFGSRPVHRAGSRAGVPPAGTTSSRRPGDCLASRRPPGGGRPTEEVWRSRKLSGKPGSDPPRGDTLGRADPPGRRPSGSRVERDRAVASATPVMGRSSGILPAGAAQDARPASSGILPSGAEREAGVGVPIARDLVTEPPRGALARPTGGRRNGLCYLWLRTSGFRARAGPGRSGAMTPSGGHRDPPQASRPVDLCPRKGARIRPSRVRTSACALPPGGRADGCGSAAWRARRGDATPLERPARSRAGEVRSASQRACPVTSTSASERARQERRPPGPRARPAARPAAAARGNPSEQRSEPAELLHAPAHLEVSQRCATGRPRRGVLPGRGTLAPTAAR